MSKPVMRFGGAEQEQKTTMDFSHLESNPKYKPEEDDAAAIQEAESQAAEAAAQAAAALENRTPQEIAQEQAEQAQAAAQAALGGQTGDKAKDQLELTEELLFKTLSEKLGKQITSFEDLQNKPVEVDSRVKEMSDWAKDTGRPIEDYFKYQKDYTGVEDKDIAREYLQLKYPTFTEQELAYKMQSMLPNEDDLEDDLLRKNIDLKTFAIEGRGHLESLKRELGTPVANLMTDEVKQKVSYFDQIQSQFDLQKKDNESYYEGLVKASSASDKVKLNLSKDLQIDFNVNADERKGIPDFIQSMSHWKNEDGSTNHETVVQDGYKVKYFEQLIQLAYEQGVNSGTSDTVRTQNNITLGDQTSRGSNQDTGSKRPIIEGLDKLLGGSKVKMRGFGK